MSENGDKKANNAGSFDYVQGLTSDSADENTPVDCLGLLWLPNSTTFSACSGLVQSQVM